ncbi:MAG: HK97 family phage prohead protease [Ignavibacterium sp.]|nr:HK97 family phage prohead protease [Ignavibacterium sp.]
MEKIFKNYESIENTIDAEKREITHIITSDTVDRDGDIVIPEGGKFDNYERNPIVLFMHNQYYPIGKNLWKKIVKDSTGTYLKVKTKITDKTELANDVFNLYSEGILKAWSIGFTPNWNKVEEIKDEKGKFLGYKFNEWELLEYSAVSIPANPDAITEAYKIVKSEELKRQIEYDEMKLKLNDLTKYDNEIKRLNDEINELKSLITEFTIDDYKLLAQAISELKENISKLEQRVLNKSAEIAGNRKDDLRKIVNEVVAGAISRIRGDL